MTIDGVEYDGRPAYVTANACAAVGRKAGGWRARKVRVIARGVRMHARHASEVNRAATWIEETIRKGV